ncbi:MAG: cytochrome c peroxidase [Pseudomonadota bacterium]
MNLRRLSPALLAISSLVISACSSDTSPEEREFARATESLKTAITSASGGQGLAAFTLPDPSDLANIPADPSNPLTAEKVALGQLLYHETALAQNPNDPAHQNDYSCASCHHVAAGFKSGVPQGIAEGGTGFGLVGEGRVLRAGMDASAPAGSPLLPDLQPLASPTVLNAAFQEVMLWNGQFGNAVNGVVNTGIDPTILSTVGTPKENNTRQLAGVEIQAVAGLGVHRLNVETDSVLQTNAEYAALFDAAYPSSTDVLEDAAKAIAAYERTLLATEAPFQRWLRGDEQAMNLQEIKGAELFFGKANCVACHTGRALSSPVGATEDRMFFAVGFADFDLADPRIHGTVGEAVAKGRGGFTGDAAFDFTFKVPQLYNLTDSAILGHGASFTRVRDVVAYKNAAVAQKPSAIPNLASEFVPLGLSDTEIDDLTAFLETGLYDANLQRFVPASLPSGNCFPVNDVQSQTEIGCGP